MLRWEWMIKFRMMKPWLYLSMNSIMGLTKGKTMKLMGKINGEQGFLVEFGPLTLQTQSKYEINEEVNTLQRNMLRCMNNPRDYLQSGRVTMPICYGVRTTRGITSS